MWMRTRKPLHGAEIQYLRRTGTLLRIEDDEIYVDADGRVELLPGVAETLASLQGQAVFVITNQSGLVKGLLTLAQVGSFIDQINAQCGDVIQDFWASPLVDSPYPSPIRACCSAWRISISSICRPRHTSVIPKMIDAVPRRLGSDHLSGPRRILAGAMGEEV